MQVSISSTVDEQVAVLKGIQRLYDTRHIKYMSQSMIAECSNVKSTKVRVVLCDLLEAGYIKAIKTTEKTKCPRFFYTVTAEGNAFIANPSKEV